MVSKLKKSLVTLCTMFVLILLPANINYAATYGDYSYYVQEDGTAILTDYNGYAANVTVPSTVDGYTVTALDCDCFYKNTNIISVTIPETVKRIEERCFYECDNLINVTLPQQGLEYIGDDAFCETALTSFTFPDTVTEVGGFAFRYTKITTITIPKNVTKWSERYGVFEDCKDLESVTFEEGCKLVPARMFSGCGLTTVNFASTIESIGEKAFAYGGTLPTLTLPEGLKKIEKDAFYNKTINKLIAPCDALILAKGAMDSCTVKELQCPVNSPLYKVYRVSNTNLILTLTTNTAKTDMAVGCTLQLEVPVNAKIKWKSSNKKVATVSSKGKVTAKKKGKVVITATGGGKKYNCTVTVKNNERKLAKYSLKASGYSEKSCVLNFRQIKRNSKGDYELSGHFINTSPQTNYKEINDLTIFVYKEDTLVAKQTYKKVKINTLVGKSEKINLTIKKKNIKKKNTDLRNGDIEVRYEWKMLSGWYIKK